MAKCTPNMPRSYVVASLRWMERARREGPPPEMASEVKPPRPAPARATRPARLSRSVAWPDRPNRSWRTCAQRWRRPPSGQLEHESTGQPLTAITVLSTAMATLRSDGGADELGGD